MGEGIMHRAAIWSHYIGWQWTRQSGVLFHCHLSRDKGCSGKMGWHRRVEKD